MSNKSIRSLGWLNLSVLLAVMLAGVFAVSAQQIISENKVDSNQPAGGGAEKSSTVKIGRKADPAPAAAGTYDWRGFYVGRPVGHGCGKGETRVQPLPDAATFISLAPTTIDPKAKGTILG